MRLAINNSSVTYKGNRDWSMYVNLEEEVENKDEQMLNVIQLLFDKS